MRIDEAVKRLNHDDPAVRDQATATVLAARQGAVAYLVNELAVPGAPVARIALLLAALKGREGLPALASLVRRGVLDVDARAAVARAFGELVSAKDAGEGDTRRALLALSRDVSPATRQLVARACAALGDDVALTRLRELARDADGAVRAAAQAALATLPPAPAGGTAASSAHEEGGLHLDLEAAVRAHQERAPAPPVVPAGPHAALHARLSDVRRAVRDGAVDEAVTQGQAALPGLLAALTLPSSSARLAAAMALARMQAPSAAPALLDAALAAAHAPPGDEGELAVAAVALKGLANSLTGAEEGVAQPLLPLVKHGDPFVRAGALLCLGRLSDRVGARAAVVALTDVHEHVKEAAAVALSEGVREEDHDLVVPLLAVLGGLPSPSPATREAILLALSRIHVTDAPTLVRVRHRARTAVLGATASVRRTALALLERSYAGDDPPPVGVIDDVLSRLTDDHPEVRLLAASFLAQHIEPGMTDAVARLEDALDRQEPPVSLLVLEALRRHDTVTARHALEAVATDVDETLAARARALLEGFAPRTEEWAHGSTPAPPPSTPPASATPSRRRRGTGEVVEAKDAPADQGGGHKDKP